MKKFILNKIQKGFTPLELLLVVGISAVVAGLFVFTANSPSNMAGLPPINVNVEAPNVTERNLYSLTCSTGNRTLGAGVVSICIQAHGLWYRKTSK